MLSGLYRKNALDCHGDVGIGPPSTLLAGTVMNGTMMNMERSYNFFLGMGAASWQVH